MKNFVVVANQDRGKTYFVKNQILKNFHDRPIFIFDINREYREFKNAYKGPINRDSFVNAIPKHDKARTVNVFEESSAFFSRAGVGDSAINEHIFRRFHTESINVFIFHGLNFVPGDILMAIDFFVIYNTNDILEKVEKKFEAYPKVIEAFKDVREKTKDTLFDRKNKFYPDQRSKDFFHYNRIVAK